MRTKVIIAWFCVACAGPNDGQTEAKSAVTARRDSIDAELSALVRRLPPDSLDSLPPNVRATLNARKCLIPQPVPPETINAVEGAFSAKGAVEWAVVCSVGGSSQILFMSSQTGTVFDSLDQGIDAKLVQQKGDSKPGYSLGIHVMWEPNVAGLKTDADGKPVPQPIDHDALDVIINDRSEIGYYRAAGNWYRVPISD